MSTLALQLPEKMRPFAEEKRRHKIARGGRGSAKSWSIARILVVKGLLGIRWLCCREIQKSTKESSYRLLVDQIHMLGLSAMYDIQSTTIKGPNGTEFVFVGLQDHTADTLKSYEGFDGAWVEEAHTISEASANKLIPTIRKPGSELLWSYNPDQEADYIHKMAERAIKTNAPDTLVVTINYDDNRWFPDVLEAERVKMLAISQDLHDHIWGGKCRSVAGLLFKRKWFRRYPLGKHPELLNPYLSSDYAGGPDPDDPEADPDYTEHGVWGVDQVGDLWALDWWSGQDDPAVWIAAWAALVKRHRPLRAFEEKGVILRSVDGAINASMRLNNAFVTREPLASAGSKSDRALGFAARAAAGTVHIPDCEWGDRLIDQLCAFNGQAGRTDDMVDVCSLLARGLDSLIRPQPETPEPAKPAVVPFSVEWLESGQDSRAETEDYLL